MSEISSYYYNLERDLTLVVSGFKCVGCGNPDLGYQAYAELYGENINNVYSNPENYKSTKRGFQTVCPGTNNLIFRGITIEWNGYNNASSDFNVIYKGNILNPSLTSSQTTYFLPILKNCVLPGQTPIWVPLLLIVLAIIFVIFFIIILYFVTR